MDLVIYIISSTNTCTLGYNTYSKTDENGPKALTELVKHKMICLLIEKSRMELLIDNISFLGKTWLFREPIYSI